MRYHLKPVKTVSSKKEEISSVSKDMEEKRTLVPCEWECNLLHLP